MDPVCWGNGFVSGAGIGVDSGIEDAAWALLEQSPAFCRGWKVGGEVGRGGEVGDVVEEPAIMVKCF